MTFRSEPDSTENPNRAEILGVRVDLVTIEDLNEIIERSVRESRRIVIGHHNLHSIFLCQRDPRMKSFHSITDYVHIDGMPLVWWAKVLGYPVTASHRVSYLDWLGPLMELAAERSWKIFYLGSKPGVAATGAGILERQYDGVQIVHHDGYFDTTRGSRDNEQVLGLIREADPDVLMVGMGMPRQEAWIADYLGELPATVILNAGACIDYVAGAIPSPPRWMGKLGLEWLFRLVSEPRRLASRYLVEPWILLPLFYRDVRRR